MSSISIVANLSISPSTCLPNTSSNSNNTSNNIIVNDKLTTFSSCCNNTKSTIMSSSSNNQSLTKIQKAVNSIKYGRGGKIQYVNSGVPLYSLPLKNKF